MEALMKKKKEFNDLLAKYKIPRKKLLEKVRNKAVPPQTPLT